MAQVVLSGCAGAVVFILLELARLWTWGVPPPCKRCALLDAAAAADRQRLQQITWDSVDWDVTPVRKPCLTPDVFPSRRDAQAVTRIDLEAPFLAGDDDPTPVRRRK